MVAIADGDG